ncbi:aspartate/glutamate racemase family protein [Flavimaricola marinus]|uniref:Asp/Glu/Hydantoin racemase n=1 Tax=Flavimaricola marinus TaxID=1819565 RepID=A0A238LLU4_9RHOB|nr:aspartate/glutamate racemase family protein [Flavimaricola marinus]SMY09916.1 Asp/Glu/Hydantoin racemase [Flavimaricola marinus]
MTLIVINPNSSQTVTDGIDAALSPLRPLGVPIRCLTLAEGPPGIEDQAQADLTIAPMLRLAAAQTDASGFVIACFGDPGLYALRSRTTLPVQGIQEAAVMTALTLGHRFGVIAILPASIPRHLRAFGAMGVLDRLAGDRSLGLGVADLADADRSLAAMIATAKRLRDEDGADVLIMGCAGMAQYRAVLEAETGLPVVEPCQAAAAMAIGQITLGQSHHVSRG